MSNIQPYIILNGTDSRSISGLLISSLPPISKPQVRTQIETVDGRDGDIVTPLGFSAYDKVINIGLTYNYDVDEIIEFFNSEGIVTFSNEPDKYYRYAIYEQIDFEKLIRFKTAEVTLHVQPFKFSTTEEPELFDVVSGQAIAVTNEGNTDSRPNLTIIGSGDIDVSLNGSQILSIELEDDQAVIIDSEDMNAYAAQSAIREVVADIEPELDTNGYGSVWIGGAGKNLFSNVWSDYTRPNDYRVFPIKLEQGQTYKIWASLKGSSISGIVVGFIKDGTQYSNFVGFQQLILAQGQIANVNAFTVDNTFTDPKLVVYCSDETQFNQIFTNYNIQLEKGSTETAWSPYENIGSISGFSALNVTRAGKNLGNFQNGYGIDASGNIVVQNNRVSTVTPIIINPSLSYYVKNVSGKRFIYAVFKDNTLIRRIANVTDGTLLDTTNGNKLYVCLYDNVTVETDKPMVVFDNAITTYEPYNGQTFNIPFDDDQGDPITVYGASLNLTTGELTIDKGIKVFDGSESWSSSGSGTNIIFQTQIDDMSSGTNQDGLTNFLPLSTSYFVYGCRLGYENKLLYVYQGLTIDGVTDLASFKQKLSSKNLVVVYPLADPIVVQLTPTQINNLLGLNNLYSDTGDITVKHKSNGVIVTDTGDIVSFYAGLDDIEKGVLLNRAITGDYDKIRLRKGVNTFVLTGNAQQFAIDKFSRWL